MKCGFEFREDVEIGVGAGEFVCCKRKRLRCGLHRSRFRFRRSAIAVGQGGDFHFNGDGFILEISGGDGGERFSVRFGGELVGLLAGDAEFARDVFCAEAHVDVGVRVVIDEPGIGGNLVAAHGDHGHGFRAAGDNDFGGAGTDTFRGEGDGLETGRAEAIDGHRTRFDGEAGAKSGDARDVHALFAFGHGAAKDHVVNFFGVEAGDASERFLDGECGEIVGARGAQGAFVGAADGSADSGDDDGLVHGRT